ncbi:rRNA-processing protein FCF2-like protein [Tanacetum coccineum]|uniref:rRNA-processing protein FCF2-like protein n=1 Tax=Tanacetum coccineum TaxID=301880 RepID=A0ABQ5F9A0_9ASTR
MMLKEVLNLYAENVPDGIQFKDIQYYDSPVQGFCFLNKECEERFICYDNVTLLPVLQMVALYKLYTDDRNKKLKEKVLRAFYFQKKSLSKHPKFKEFHNVMDPKTHNKKGESKLNSFPKYFQVGTVVEPVVSKYYNTRLTKRERKHTIADKLLVNHAYRMRKDDDLEEDQEDDGNDRDTFDIWDITTEDVERIRQFFTPNVPDVIENRRDLECPKVNEKGKVILTKDCRGASKYFFERRTQFQILRIIGGIQVHHEYRAFVPYSTKEFPYMECSKHLKHHTYTLKVSDCYFHQLDQVEGMVTRSILGNMLNRISLDYQVVDDSVIARGSRLSMD